MHQSTTTVRFISYHRFCKQASWSWTVFLSHLSHLFSSKTFRMSRVSDPVLRTRKCDARALYCQPATWREFKAGKWKAHQRLTDSSSAITRGTPALRSLNITLKDNESRHLSRLRLDVIIPKLHVQRGVSAERFGRRKVLKSAWRAAIHHSLWLHCIHRGSFVFPRKFEDQD